MELTSRNLSNICQNKMLFIVSLFYYVLLKCLLSAVDLLGTFAERVKRLKFPLLSQEPNLKHRCTHMCTPHLILISLGLRMSLILYMIPLWMIFTQLQYTQQCIKVYCTYVT